MKNLIVCALVLVTTSVFAQSKTVEEFQAKYKDHQDAKVVSLNGGLFQLLASITSWDENDEEAQVVSRIASNIKSMKILAIPVKTTGFDKKQVDKMRKELGTEKYEEMMTMRDGDEKIYMLTQGTKNEIKNMLVLIQDQEEFVVMNVDGALDMKDLAYLAKNCKKYD